MSLGQLAGRLPQARRAALIGDVQQVVDGWIDAAYLAGDYPRTDFDDSWPGFTAGARAKARRDADLMSNRELGAVRSTASRPRSARSGSTCSASGSGPWASRRTWWCGSRRRATTTKDVRVAGRLFLTKGEQGWQVFGYDVTKDAR